MLCAACCVTCAPPPAPTHPPAPRKRAPARRGAAAPSLARAALLCALACVASSPLPLSSRPHGGALLPVASARPLTNGDAAEVQPEQLDLASAHAPGWHGFVDPTRVEVLSNGPVTRAYVYRGLLTPEECDHIVGVSQTRLMRSGVVDTETGASAVSEIRTSSGARRGAETSTTGVWSAQEELAGAAPRMAPQ